MSYELGFPKNWYSSWSSTGFGSEIPFRTDFAAQTRTHKAHKKTNPDRSPNINYPDLYTYKQLAT